MHRAHAAYQQFPEDDRGLILRFSSVIDRLARRCAARTGGAVAAEDLWSAGALGLLDAAGRFDQARGVRFETFAEHRIRGAMVDELRRLDHLPRRLRDKTDAVKEARQKLSDELGRPPEAEELAAKLGVTVDELDGLDTLAQPPLALDPEAPLASQEPAQDDVLEQKQASEKLQAAIRALPERLQTVLSLHYVEGLTYREIAFVLEVSEPRVCQLHGEAVKKLRGILEPEGANDEE